MELFQNWIHTGIIEDIPPHYYERIRSQTSLPIDFLLQPNLQHTPEFTSRHIDFLIHCIQRPTMEQHSVLQHYIEFLVQDNERLVFNAIVHYPYGRHLLNGPNGAMSNLLTAYNFYLYNQMTDVPGMQHNQDDILILLQLTYHFKYDDQGRLLLPQEEFRAFQRILEKNRRLGIHPELFDPRFWKSYLHVLSPLIDFDFELLRTDCPGLFERRNQETIFPIHHILSRPELFRDLSPHLAEAVLDPMSMAYYAASALNSRMGAFERMPTYLEHLPVTLDEELFKITNIAYQFIGFYVAIDEYDSLEGKKKRRRKSKRRT